MVSARTSDQSVAAQFRLPGPRASLLHAAVFAPLLQAPLRTLLAVLAIALGVALGFSIHLINRVAADEVQLASRSLFGRADLAVRAPGGLAEELYPRLARVAGVRVASPVVEVQGRLPGRERPLKLLGIDPFRATLLQPALASAAGSAGAGEDSGVVGEDAVWLSPAAAQQLDLAAGDTLEVQVGLTLVQFRVAGLLPAGEYPQPVGVLDVATAQWRLDRLGRLDRIDLRLEPGADLARVSTALRALLPPGVELVTPDEAGEDATRLTRAYRSNLTALALVALFTGGFLVYATQSLAVARRRREIALLHALGLTLREQLGAILLGAALVGALGAALGIVLGALVARTGLARFGADLGAGYFTGLAADLQLRPLEALLFFALGMAAAVLSSVGPAREAAGVPAARALRAGDETPSGARRHGWLALAFTVLAVIALAMPPIEGIALPGYFAIACLLFAAVAITPGVSAWVFAHLPDASEPAWRALAVAQLRGSARTAMVSVAAVLVSFGLMVAMAIMVHSFRESLDDWMQRILPADLYLRSGSGTQSAYFDEDAQRRIAAVPGLEHVEFVRFRNVAMPGGGLPLTVIARPIVEREAAQRLPLRRTDPNPAPPGTLPVWASEAAFDLRGLAPGTVFELPLEGRLVRCSVRGLWRDYDRSGGSIVMDAAEYRRLTGDTRANNAALWLAPGADPEATAAAVRAALASDERYDLAWPGEIRRLSLQAFDRTFLVTYLIEAVAVLIGLFGIAASTSSQVLARRGEFGMLRHLGLTRREIARMLGFEGAALGALGVLLGLVAGVLISLVLVYVVNRQSFHWTMDLHVPWGLLALLSAALIGAAALAAVLSGRQAMGDDVVRAVKEDW